MEVFIFFIYYLIFFYQRYPDSRSPPDWRRADNIKIQRTTRARPHYTFPIRGDVSPRRARPMRSIRLVNSKEEDKSVCVQGIKKDVISAERLNMIAGTNSATNKKRVSQQT